MTWKTERSSMGGFAQDGAESLPCALRSGRRNAGMRSARCGSSARTTSSGGSSWPRWWLPRTRATTSRGSSPAIRALLRTAVAIQISLRNKQLWAKIGGFGSKCVSFGPFWVVLGTKKETPFQNFRPPGGEHLVLAGRWRLALAVQGEAAGPFWTKLIFGFFVLFFVPTYQISSFPRSRATYSSAFFGFLVFLQFYQMMIVAV